MIHDYIDDSKNNEEITSGSGNDTIVGSLGNDVINSNGGYDLLTYHELKKDRTYEEDQDGFRFVFDADDQNQLIVYERSYYNVADENGNPVEQFDWRHLFTDHVENVESVYATDKDDVIQGNSENNVINAGRGQDGIYGGSGNNHLDGYFGNDYIFAGENSSTLVGGEGIDTLIGSQEKEDLVSYNYIDSTDGNGVNLKLSGVATVGAAQVDIGTLIDSEKTFVQILGFEIPIDNNENQTLNEIYSTLWGSTESQEDEAENKPHILPDKWQSSLEKLKRKLSLTEAGLSEFAEKANTLSKENLKKVKGVSKANDAIIVEALKNSDTRVITTTYFLKAAEAGITYALEVEESYENGALTKTRAMVEGGVEGTVELLVEEAGAKVSGTLIASALTLLAVTNPVVLIGVGVLGAMGSAYVISQFSDDIGDVAGEIVKYYYERSDIGDIKEYFEDESVDVYHAAYEDQLIEYYETGKISVDEYGNTIRQSNVDADILVGIEHVEGSQFSDKLMGNVENNNLLGNLGDDALFGAEGEDTLIGGLGNDLLKGGKDNDTLIGSQGNDTMEGDSGVDTIDYSYVTEAYNGDCITLINLSDIDTSLEDDSGIHTIDGLKTKVIDSMGNVLESDDLESIENVIGSFGTDKIFGNSDGNYIRANSGDDTVLSGGGNDVLHGGHGDDVLMGGQGNDTIFGGEGNDQIDGGNDHDLINNRWFDQDVIDGGEGNDTLDYQHLEAVRTNILFSSDSSANGKVTVVSNSGNEYTDTYENIETIITASSDGSIQLSNNQFLTGTAKFNSQTNSYQVDGFDDIHIYKELDIETYDTNVLVFNTKNNQKIKDPNYWHWFIISLQRTNFSCR